LASGESIARGKKGNYAGGRVRIKKKKQEQYKQADNPDIGAMSKKFKAGFWEKF